MIKRNRLIMFILERFFSFFYIIYWYYSVIDSLNKQKIIKDKPFLSVILIIITLGIYTIYINWKLAGLFFKETGYDNRVICLMFSLTIIIGYTFNIIILQGSINYILDNKEKNMVNSY